jgi:hypothetical protein
MPRTIPAVCGTPGRFVSLAGSRSTGGQHSIPPDNYAKRADEDLRYVNANHSSTVQLIVPMLPFPSCPRRCLAASQGERAELRGHPNHEEHHADLKQVPLGQAHRDGIYGEGIGARTSLDGLLSVPVGLTALVV